MSAISSPIYGAAETLSMSSIFRAVKIVGRRCECLCCWYDILCCRPAKSQWPAGNTTEASLGRSVSLAGAVCDVGNRVGGENDRSTELGCARRLVADGKVESAGLIDAPCAGGVEDVVEGIVLGNEAAGLAEAAGQVVDAVGSAQGKAAAGVWIRSAQLEASTNSYSAGIPPPVVGSVVADWPVER